jgi:hypothetical protein
MMFVDFGWLGQNWLSVLCFVWTDQNSLSLREWDVLRILLSANYKLYWSRGSLCSFTVLLFCTWWLLYVLFCSGQPKRNCISVSLALLYTFYGCFGWAEQNCSFVVSAFIGFSVFLWRRLLCSVKTSERVFGFWVLIGPSKNAHCSHEREFLFIILAAPTKTKNSEQNWKLRAKSRTARKMGNTEETGKHRAKWENTDHNGLTLSKKAKPWAKFAKLANICAL